MWATNACGVVLVSVMCLTYAMDLSVSPLTIELVDVAAGTIAYKQVTLPDAIKTLSLPETRQAMVVLSRQYSSMCRQQHRPIVAMEIHKAFLRVLLDHAQHLQMASSKH